jgi:hypothetical protein
MHTPKRLWRALLYILLTAAICGSFAFSEVEAAPKQAVVPPHMVISEFRTRGPAGANDEFVEIFNATGSPVNLNNWSIRKSSGCATSTDPLVANINTTLVPGQYYLIGNTGNASSPGYAGQMDQSYPASASIANNGGIALLDSSGTIVDQVGMCNDTLYKEPPTLDQLTADVDQSYERKTASNPTNCNDSDNNAADFLLNASSSNPQTSSSDPQPCLVVTNVNSSASNGAYSAGATIAITVSFNNNVDVTGSPTLLLETGVKDTPATYTSGSGTNALTFQYTVAAGDSSGDLDYVASDSLSLNGGSIIGAMGNANLALPAPGSAGSLSANKDIVIDNGDAPSLVSIKRQNPNSSPTNVNSLVFRVTFSETVTNVDANDFVVHPNETGATTNAAISAITPTGNNNYYDVTVSGGNLATFNGDVGLDLSASQNIADLSAKALNLTIAPTADELYTVDHVAPSVTINQATDQADPTSTPPVKFNVVFSEPIDVNSFTSADIKQNGTAKFITWTITDSGDHKNFLLLATSIAQNGTLIPSVIVDASNPVTDLAGNKISPSTSTDNNVDYTDNVRPTVTVNQASTQADPTNAVPILFSVVFSEPINVSSFTTSDIKQNGSATGVTWKITDSGNHQTFTLSATTLTGSGTIIPSIDANRVADRVGNTNQASTSTDNSVTYTTAAPSAYHSVIINEIAWSGTKASSDDEWIELYNTTNNTIDLNNWELKSDDGSPTISLAGLTIAGKSYLLLARNADTFKDVTPDLIYGKQTSSQGLLNSGEILRLRIKTSNTLIDVANSYTGYGFTKWAAGTGTPNYASMERGAYSFSTPSEWVTFAGTPTVHDRSNNLVYGTPGEENWINSTAIAITTIISDTPDPSLVNQFVSVTVTVVGGAATPTGTVVITGANTNCTITLSGGIGSCSIKFTSVGSKTITAAYSGDKLHPSSSDTESHQVTSSFVTTPTRAATPLPPPPLLALNEFVPRPGHDWNNDGVVNAGDEYIEVLNHGVVNVNLSGYTLDDEVNVGSDPYRLPALTLRPGERYVFYGSETGILLGDGGDGVRLLKPNGQLADAYNYTVVERPDQSFCRLPDNGGADDWNQNCYPTPGLQNSQNEGSTASNTTKELYCPIADTLPDAFVEAECEPFGNDIWRPEFWDKTGWYGDQYIPGINAKWPVFAN